MDTNGKLYVVATPIGNQDDITLRAIHVLGTVDLIAAEDTRHTGKLLARHNIKSKLVSYHEYNEKERAPELIQKLRDGASLALVSNAGTPAVSDPGYRLVNAAIENGITVVPIPGVSAAVTALSAAGLPTDAFIFIGFPQKKKGKRSEQLKRLARESATLVFYESPRRILLFMEEVIENMGDRYAVLGREMTKFHEEFLRGKLSEILNALQERDAIKGECTLLIKGCEEEDKAEEISPEAMRHEIEQELETAGISELSKKLAKKYGLSRKSVYEEILKVKKN
ncbi:MAG: 16S rRNA (cytidine(1402)-2'-O)-methyltransferase [Desulfobacteraceae bacterium IS3]|nr:MAG: 16S rRNA (cytidine(1402)-2'-O)-methyltransferase [Desulfobacteraceae bacterium IS3]